MEFYKQILEKLQDDQNVYLLTVVQNIGSSPGRQGFKMFVSQDGNISGSIGGGIMEYQFVEKVKKNLQTDKLKVFFKRQVHQIKAKESSGMFCSGEQTIVFHPLSKKDIPAVIQIISNLETNKEVLLELNPNGIFISKKFQKEQFNFKNGENWCYKEQLNYKEIFYIIGAGHVGLAVSKILNNLGFYVVIFDNRKGLNTLAQNTFAQEQHIVNYDKINQYIEPNNFVAIMTSNFVDDKKILLKIIDKNHRYLGVLGSKVKIKMMFKSLMKEGVSKELLNAVFAPIGYPIKSQTPEEIAISIAAQVVGVKNLNY